MPSFEQPFKYDAGRYKFRSALGKQACLMEDPSKIVPESSPAPADTPKPWQFQPGNPGGPGRPAGSRNKASLALDKIADDAGEDILNKMVETAKGGDLRAADLVLQRIWPVRKGRPLSLSLPLPVIKTAADVVMALGTVADLVGAGEVTPDEGAALAAIFESKRRAIETVDLEARLSALEQERK